MMLENGSKGLVKFRPHFQGHVRPESSGHQSNGFSHGGEDDALPLEGSVGTRRLFVL